MLVRVTGSLQEPLVKLEPVPRVLKELPPLRVGVGSTGSAEKRSCCSAGIVGVLERGASFGDVLGFVG